MTLRRRILPLLFPLLLWLPMSDASAGDFECANRLGLCGFSALGPTKPGHVFEGGCRDLAGDGLLVANALLDSIRQAQAVVAFMDDKDEDASVKVVALDD